MRGGRLRALVLAGAMLVASAPGIASADPDSATVAAPDTAAAESPPPPEAPAAVPSAARARGPRIPGTSLRLGDSLSLVRRWPELRAVSDPELQPGELAYGGTLRFYGAPGNAKLVFHDGVLARATLVLKPASPRTRAYVEDDLRRLGYRADCRRTAADDRDCEWTGPLVAIVRADTARLTADFGAPGVARAASEGTRPRLRLGANDLQTVLASDSTPILPDTLDLRADNPNGYPKPVIAKSAFARIPDDLRGSVERGLISLIAFVGADGQVLYATATDGPEELKDIARDAVMQYRFQRYQTREGRWRFWIRLTVYPA